MLSTIYNLKKKIYKNNGENKNKSRNKNKISLNNILDNKINDNLKIEIEKITNEDKAYIAGFLDGDGSLLAQIVKGSYKYGFTIRFTIQFVQNKKYHNIML